MSPAFQRWLPLYIGGLLLSCCSPREKPSPLLPAEITLARTHIDAGRPDLALAILAADPENEITRKLIQNTEWSIPTAQIGHPGFEIHHIAIHGDSLWVGLARPPFHTVVRWNLESLEIESVLFPARDPLRAFILSPTADHAVVARGEVHLLVDAKSLKPIADLGEIPPDITAESTIVFSQNSLIVAHPAEAGWLIRDTATGEIIRSIGSEEISGYPAIAGHLSPHGLRLLTRDGTRIDAPVSPVEPLVIETFDDELLKILHAHLIDSDRGDTALILRDLGPHEPAALIEFQFVDRYRSDVFDIDEWAAGQSHSNLPGLATGLLRHFDPPILTFTESAIVFPGGGRGALLTESPPVAYTKNAADGSLATAESSGRVSIHHGIRISENDDSSRLSPEALIGISGHRYDRKSASFLPLTAKARHAAFKTDRFRAARSASLTALHQRLADAEELPADSPAHQLAHALTETDVATLTSILEANPSLPATLRTLATSHLHLRHGDTAAAFAPYHLGFPDIARIRLREDWHGWEQPDFQPAVDLLEHAYHAIIQTLTIDPDSEENERQKTIARLTDPIAIGTLGRARYAIACLDAARTLTLIAGEAEHAFTLATLARHHGAPTVACLRVEALALTALEKFPEAHARWIEIITDHPAAEHHANDYAEAAYTAFENADSRQAIAILIRGMHGFGEDASFALRCGWIALLAGHNDHARAFLLKGREAGYPDDEIEHATALLASSAALVHDSASAAAHFQDLIVLDSSWAEAETIEALPWPEHLKEPLLQLTW